MNTLKMRNVPILSYYESDAEDDRMSDEDYSPNEHMDVESDTESIYDNNYDSDEEYLPMKFTPLDMVQKSKKVEKVENVVFVMQKDISKNIIDRKKNGKETVLRRSKRLSKKT